MKVDQTAAVFRVGRRRLAKHIAALRAHVAEARRELDGGGMEPEAQERLARTVGRVEASIADLELALAAAPKVEPIDPSRHYTAWALD